MMPCVSSLVEGAPFLRAFDHPSFTIKQKKYNSSEGEVGMLCLGAAHIAGEGFPGVILPTHPARQRPDFPAWT